MKRVIIAGTILLLAGCSINRQAEVSSTDAPNGIVRLDYGRCHAAKRPGLMSMLITVRQPKPVNIWATPLRQPTGSQLKPAP